MLKGIFLVCAFTIGLSAYGTEKLKEEMINIINSDVQFFTKVEPGMGFRGEMLSDLVHDGTYQNCTIAFRGKSILINSDLDPSYNYTYQEHWVDINIKPGNNCNPDLYPKGKRKFVAMENKRNPLEVLDILEDQQDLGIEKKGEKIYVLKYSLRDDETGEVVDLTHEYDLHFPLFLNPNAANFKHQVFDTDSIDLSSLALCLPIDQGGSCSEEQNLEYLRR